MIKHIIWAYLHDLLNDRESKSACGEVGGVEKISSTGSKLMDRGEECFKVELVPVEGSGGETFGDGGGTIW
ncbi:hypothetical protein Tco_1510411 [Tanacetum coccineum]